MHCNLIFGKCIFSESQNPSPGTNLLLARLTSLVAQSWWLFSLSFFTDASTLLLKTDFSTLVFFRIELSKTLLNQRDQSYFFWLIWKFCFGFSFQWTRYCWVRIVQPTLKRFDLLKNWYSKTYHSERLLRNSRSRCCLFSWAFAFVALFSTWNWLFFWLLLY